jgi:hypothetical protein
VDGVANITGLNRRISAYFPSNRAKMCEAVTIIYNLKNKITLCTRYRLAQTPVK